MEELSLFEADKPKYEEEKSIFGGIYKDKGVPNEKVTEWSIAWGRDCTCCIYDGITDIEEIVEHGGLHNFELVHGYALALNLIKKEWYIRNSGIKSSPDYIIGQGKFNPGFYESLEKYRRILMK